MPVGAWPRRYKLPIFYILRLPRGVVIHSSEAGHVEIHQKGVESGVETIRRYVGDAGDDHHCACPHVVEVDNSHPLAAESTTAVTASFENGRVGFTMTKAVAFLSNDTN